MANTNKAAPADFACRPAPETRQTQIFYDAASYSAFPHDYEGCVAAVENSWPLENSDSLARQLENVDLKPGMVVNIAFASSDFER